MSLSELAKVSEEGVAFASHLDGSRHMLTPERSMEIQALLGSDIVMAFDQLVPTTDDAARRRRRRWRARCAGRARSRDGVRAGDRAPCSASSRAGSTRGCARPRPTRSTAIGFDGYAVGGLAVGEGQEAMFACLDFAPRPAARGRRRAI